MTHASQQPSTLRIGKRYRPNRLSGPYDAIVIGSGIGGLCAAACLSKAGKKVLVLEQHYTAGGYTHAYARAGYEWDVGVHYIGDMGHPNTLGRKLFDYITDGQLQWASMGDVYDRIFIGDESFDFPAGKPQFVEALKARFPDEHAAIDRYMAMLNEMAQGMKWFTVGKITQKYVGKGLGWLTGQSMPDYFNKSTYEVLSGLTQNQKLIAVLTGQWGDCGVPPGESSFIIHATIAKHYLHGGYYPVGGASKIAETIIPVIERGGGNVFTYADVEEICIENGRTAGVRMKDGTQIRCRQVISNAGVFNTFNRLLPEATAEKQGYMKKQAAIKPSMAHLCLYIGLNGTAEELKLPKTNFWLYPNEFSDANVERFRHDSSAPFPLVFISFPSAKDPSWQRRYPGRSTIEIVAPANFADFAPWQGTLWGKRGDDYEALKADLSEKLLAYLFLHLPHLREHVDYYELSTPLSTDYFCRYSRGELYGLEHDVQRFDQDWLRPKTKIPGLYLTGQDTLSCGVVGALICGLMTTLAIEGLQGASLAKRIFVDKAPITISGSPVGAT